MPAFNPEVQKARRQALIDATIIAIAKYGLNNITLSKISVIAGLTAGTVNFHFDTKEKLLLETLNFVSEEFENTIALELEQAGSNPARQLEAIINTTFSPTIADYNKMAVWHAFDSESSSREDYMSICNQRNEESFALIYKCCKQIIRQKNKETEINVTAIAHAIDGLLDAQYTELFYAGADADPRKSKQICMDFLASIFPWRFNFSNKSNENLSVISGPIKIIKAGLAELEKAATLFDQYRQFYKQAPNIDQAKEFISERIKTSSSVIYIALDADNGALGFTQLYSSYCSVDTSPIWILYDLYVAEHARKNGVAKALMDKALTMAKETGASRIDLETAINNTSAQKLYESFGYQRDTEYYKYSLEL